MSRASAGSAPVFIEKFGYFGSPWIFFFHINFDFLKKHCINIVPLLTTEVSGNPLNFGPRVNALLVSP